LHDTNEISRHEPELFDCKGLRIEEAAPIVSTDRTVFCCCNFETVEIVICCMSAR